MCVPTKSMRGFSLGMRARAPLASHGADEDEGGCHENESFGGVACTTRAAWRDHQSALRKHGTAYDLAAASVRWRLCARHLQSCDAKVARSVWTASLAVPRELSRAKTPYDAAAQRPAVASRPSAGTCV